MRTKVKEAYGKSNNLLIKEMWENCVIFKEDRLFTTKNILDAAYRVGL